MAKIFSLSQFKQPQRTFGTKLSEKENNRLLKPEVSSNCLNKSFLLSEKANFAGQLPPLSIKKIKWAYFSDTVV